MPDTPYFTVAEARKVKALSNAEAYPDADIDEIRGAVEEALEHACGVAFVPRTATEALDGTGGHEILLRQPLPLSVSAATVAGAALDPDAIADLKLYPSGIVYRAAGWPAGRQNVQITYSHGWAAVPGRVKRAAILLTKRFLVASPVDDRTTMLANEDGTRQFFVTAGVREAIFDVPEANAVIAEYGMRADVA